MLCQPFSLWHLLQNSGVPLVQAEPAEVSEDELHSVRVEDAPHRVRKQESAQQLQELPAHFGCNYARDEHECLIQGSDCLRGI